jgi:hypothetical protein
MSTSKIPSNICKPGRRGPITQRKSGAGFHVTRKPRGAMKRQAITEASA